MGFDSPKTQVYGGGAAFFSQRVEDNAFHLATRRVSSDLYISLKFAWAF
jgi:hypothetical protein